MGCRRSSKIDPPAAPVQAAVQVNRLPETTASHDDQRWYRDLMPTSEPEEPVEKKDPNESEKPKPKEKERPWVSIETKIEPPDATGEKPRTKPLLPPAPSVSEASAEANAQALVGEIHARIKGVRRVGANWCLLRLELKPSKADLQLTVDVGWTDLYAVRPEILFDQLRFEDCMNRLARMAHLRYAQARRWGNPLVTWRGESSSVYEAVRAITKKHGFAARFVSGGTRVTFELANFESREEFVVKVTERVVQEGANLRQKLPTMLISLAPKSSEEDASGDPAKRAFGPGRGGPPELRERARALRELPPEQRRQAVEALMKDVAIRAEELQEEGRVEEAAQLRKALEQMKMRVKMMGK